MNNLLLRATALAFTGLVAGACAEGSQAATTTTSPTEPADAGDGSVQTDAQVVQVARSANQAEVDEGMLAQARALSLAVRAFATRMVDEHGAANQRLDALTASKGIVPADSAVNQTLLSESNASLDALRAAPEASFDRAYVGAQIVAHERVLAILDQTLIPTTVDPQLKDELVRMRADVSAHLVAASALDATLPPTNDGQVAP